jgi:Zn-dependent protease with chaperone function
MDFFGQQERARASTKRLVVLFVLAVVLTNLAIYLALTGVFLTTYVLTGFGTRSAADQGWFVRLAHHFAADGIWNWELLGWVTLFVTTVVGLVSCYKLRQLSGGGAVVARLLGGRRVSLNTTDADERRLLNLVEEMAIAAGLPVPEVYVLDEESGVNAFAAGNEVADAEVGVTFGAVKLLNRDELQGVIAHEFSHILNGDMRLNTQLIGWLHGLLGLVVLGKILSLDFLSRAETPDGERVGPIFHPVFLPAFILGWICIVAGSCGAFVARLIKSAVSRQREYLADAAAIQFTRNPDGLVGALKKIGGLSRRSVIGAARAEEASHMYFSDGMRPRWFGFLATHPPLLKRIRRINPGFDGKFPTVSLERVLRESRVTALYREQRDGKAVDFTKLASVIGASAAVQEMLYVQAALEMGVRPPVAKTAIVPPPAVVPMMHLEFAMVVLGAIPDSLRAATHQPVLAVALMYGMICSKEPEMRASQMAALADQIEPEMIAELNRLLPVLDELDAGLMLPLADLSVRALSQLSAEQYEIFRNNLEWLVAADQQIDLFEYMLQRMLVRQLDPYFRPVKKAPVQYYTLKPLLLDGAILLSGLARIGHESEAEAQTAFEQGAALLGVAPELCFLPLAECNLPQIDEAIGRIAQATPQLKQQILTALICVAATDGQLQKREAELLRAVADALGLPVPPFLGAPPPLAGAMAG